jgi:hypothetical protein
VNQRDTVPVGLVWLPDGHVSDWVLNALVDNEVALLPDEAVAHADTCEHCTERMATMATMAFALGEELSLLAEQQAKHRAPFPLALFAAAFVFTSGFALFSWSDQGRNLVELPHELLTVWRGLRLVGPFAARHLSAELIVLSSVTALLAAFGGVLLAKRHPFTRSPESPS